MVITRQRPGTAKGFVFLTLEDETGISNVIIRSDLFDRQRTVAVARTQKQPLGNRPRASKGLAAST